MQYLDRRKLAEALFPLRIIRTWVRHALVRASRSLAGRLLLALLALAGVLLLLQIQAYSNRAQARAEMLQESREQAADLSLGAFRQRLEQLGAVQRSIGKTILQERIPELQVRSFLGDIHESHQALARVEITDDRGALLYVYPEQFAPASLAGEPFFRALQTDRSGKPQLSDVRPGPTSSGDTFRVSLRLEAASAGGQGGMISMVFYTGALHNFVSTEESQHLLLLDGTGRLAFASRSVEVAEVLRTDSPLRRIIGERRHGYGPAGALDGTEYTGVARSVGDTGWMLVTLYPEVPTGLQEEAFGALALTGLLMLVVAGVVALVLRISLRPLDRLSAAALRLGADARRAEMGSNPHPLPELQPEVTEFERLVQAFNSMRTDLDATHRQLVETQRLLERANGDLREKVRARELELEEEHRKVLRAERLSTLGLLSSAIAHDLRNPLNTIGLGLHWLQARLADTADDRVRQRIEALLRELRRSEQIIRTLLAFARTGEPERSPTDLSELVREVLGVVNLPDAISLELDLDHRLNRVEVDRAQLFQVLENLVRNAAQAMPDGGTVHVITRRVPGRCRISVSDTGPGIPEDLQESVFEPLVTTKSAGTGLGLALCRRIVEAHGGRIWVESAPGGGAAFLLELPLQPPPSPLPGIPDHSGVDEGPTEDSSPGSTHEMDAEGAASLAAHGR